MKLTFPPTFLFGVATAGLQIEGGDRNNTWYEWSEMGRIKDGSHSLRAGDHWNRWREDGELLTELGIQTYRLGVEWSRLEPEEGRFSDEALGHYRDEIQLLLRNGIRPLVTLYHFTLPLWFARDGGWENPVSPQRFMRFVRFVLEGLGDLVQDWVTINEPNIYLTMGYVRGQWPPGLSGAVDEMLQAARNLVRAHALAYDVLHSHSQGEVRVGVAHHLRVFDPVGGPLSRLTAWLHERVFQTMFLEAMTSGKWIPPLGRGYPLGKRPLSDFLGVNYYTRDLVRWKWGADPLNGELFVKEGAPVNELGWEIYPEGLGRLIRRLGARYGIPIWITENGVCDAHDTLRPAFLRDHLEVIYRCLVEGYDVQRYYHWTLYDNFEWIEGESARFGLYANDFETQRRTLRPSGRLYAEIARTRTLIVDRD